MPSRAAQEQWDQLTGLQIPEGRDEVERLEIVAHIFLFD